MQIAIGESTWPVLEQLRVAADLLRAGGAPPLRVADILGGHLAFVLFRVLHHAARRSCWSRPPSARCTRWWALATLPIAALVGLAVAAPTFAYAASIRSDSYLAMLFRFAVIPMSLFSGVFFPVESLPVVLRWLAYVLPLWHGVDLCRAATLGVAAGSGRSPGTCSIWRPGRSPAGCWRVRAFRRRLVV